MSPRRSEYAAYALVIFLSAWLVFQVQPIISKAILPWFGGSPAVWSTCLVFFQMALFAGYLYAHGLSQLKPLHQAIIHLVLALVATTLLPILPSPEWKPTGAEPPSSAILVLLVVHVGLPYLVLSATGPLLQSWFARGFPHTSPYRLYSLSNAGSLIALLSYPIVFEPAFAIQMQGLIWSVGFGVFALLLIILAVRQNMYATAAPIDEDTKSKNPAVTTRWHYALWILLPALATAMLMATTNHVCTDVAVVPFLWIAPLSLYLVTFIWAFASESVYPQRVLSMLTLIALLGVCHCSLSRGLELLWLEVLIYFSAMFFLCLLCHCELVRIKPPSQRLTLFYLMISLGGAAGGMFTALVCPQIFNSYAEMQICTLVGYGLALLVVLKAMKTVEQYTKLRVPIKVGLSLGLLICIWAVWSSAPKHVIESRRSFYGVLYITQPAAAEGFAHRALQHGSTTHGIQFLDPKKRNYPSSYYYPTSGIGLAFRQYRVVHPGPIHVGVVGLGVGTLSTYGLRGDRFQFYEINSDVINIASTKFLFLKECRSSVLIKRGDARLTLERQTNQQFDILVLDAFSSDSVPAHLLTREAFDVYERHMKPTGVIAVHVSNRFLDLPTVVAQHAEARQLSWRFIFETGSQTPTDSQTQWILISRDQSLLSDKKIVAASSKRKIRKLRMWTDQYSNLLQILK